MTIGAFAWNLSLFLIATAAGCGGDGLGRVSVEGTVSVDGSPLPQGSLSLIPAAGTTGPTAGAAIENGDYFIAADKGPVPGTYRVEIKAMRKTGRQIVDDHQPPPNNLLDEMEQFIPPQYNTDSKLSVKLKAGRNRDVNFALSTKD